MNCPKCGEPMRQRWGLRGTSPHYRTELGHGCRNFTGCFLAGLVIYDDYTPETIEDLHTKMANSPTNQLYMKLARQARGMK